MSKVKWKYLVYPGMKDHMYRIYEDGSIYSTKTKIFINPYMDSNCYLVFTAWIGGRQHTIRLNRCLAMMFNPKTKNDIARGRDIVHFVDFDINNYSLSNLKWVNPLELSILNDIRNSNAKCTPTARSKYIIKLATKGYSADEIIDVLELKTTAATRKAVQNIITKNI